jgi:hypothetical protein
MQLFIPAKSKKEAERAAPRWACRIVRVTGGFLVFDSKVALQSWRENFGDTEIAPTSK